MVRRRAFCEVVLDRLIPFGEVQAKAMFGGYGLYRDGRMFGLITRNDGLYFRTDSLNRGEYEAAGMSPFVPFADRPTVMPYHRVPEDVFGDPTRLAEWAEAACGAAGRAGARKTVRKTRR